MSVLRSASQNWGKVELEEKTQSPNPVASVRAGLTPPQDSQFFGDAFPSRHGFRINSTNSRFSPQVPLLLQPPPLPSFASLPPVLRSPFPPPVRPHWPNLNHFPGPSKQAIGEVNGMCHLLWLCYIRANKSTMYRTLRSGEQGHGNLSTSIAPYLILSAHAPSGGREPMGLAPVRRCHGCSLLYYTKYLPVRAFLQVQSK